MKKAVLGGTFDPPHFGHLLVARQVLEQRLDIDEIVLMPANTNPDKTVYANAHDRLAMTKLIEENNIYVSDMDIKRGGPTYTKDTVRELLKDSNNTYEFIIGSDLIETIKTWEGYDAYLRQIPFIVFPRPDYPVQKNDSQMIVLSPNDLLSANYSSTLIRKRIYEGKSITGLVSEKIENYIQMHGLYRKPNNYA